MVASQYGDKDDMLETGETVRQFVRSYFGFRHGFLAIVAIVIVGWAALFAVVFAGATKAFNFQRR